MHGYRRRGWETEKEKGRRREAFSTVPGAKDPTTKARAGQDKGQWHNARRKAHLFSPPPRAWDEGCRKTAFGDSIPTNRTTRTNDDRRRHVSGQRKRPALPRTPNPNPPRCMAMPPNQTEGGFWAFHITFRVAEPEGLARRLPPLANGVTDQGLGEVTSTARNGAGNPVLCDGQSQRACPAGKPVVPRDIQPISPCLGGDEQQ